MVFKNVITLCSTTDSQVDGHNDTAGHRVKAKAVLGPKSETRQSKLTAEVQNRQVKSLRKHERTIWNS